MLVVALHVSCWGQTTGPLVVRGSTEVGISYHWHHREVPGFLPDDPDWDEPWVSLRHGVTDWLNGSISGLAYPFRDDRFPKSHLRSYQIGIGASAKVLDLGYLQFVTGLEYAERLIFDTTRYRRDQLIESVLATAEVQHVFSVPFRPVFSLGASYLVDEINQYWSMSSDKSAHNLGILVSADFLVCRNLHISARAISVKFVQPQIGIAYAF
jgi:hypothetical protein